MEWNIFLNSLYMVYYKYAIEKQILIRNYDEIYIVLDFLLIMI